MKKTLLISIIIAYTLIIGTVNAQNWQEVGTGSNALQSGYGSITAISSDSNGNVYAIGGFYDPTTANTAVMKWNGTSWAPLGDFAPTVGTIKCLCTDKDGNVYVGGDFVNSTDMSNYSYFVNKWNGTSWSEVGGMDALDANSSIDVLAADDAGNIYATGEFNQHNSPNNRYVAKWDGTSWSDLDANGLALGASKVQAMTTRDGIVYIIGTKTNDANGDETVFKWDGSVWSMVGDNSNSIVFNDASDFSSIGVTPNGDVYVGFLNQDNTHTQSVAKWDGTTWSKLPVTVGNTQSSLVHVDYYGNVYTAFLETNSSNVQKSSVKKLSGTTWNDLGNLNGSNLVSTMYSDKKGNLFAAGLFQDATPNTYIAEYGKYSALSVVRGTYADNNIKIYPNPAQDVITVDIPSDLISTPYYIYDARGVLHTSGVLTAATSTLNVDQLSTGLYFVQLGDLSKNAFKLMKK